jgi:hypothetical protein
MLLSDRSGRAALTPISGESIVTLRLAEGKEMGSLAAFL